MKVQRHNRFPCGMETDNKIEAWGGFFWIAFDKKVECPIHGQECKSAAKVASQLRDYQ